MNILAIIIQLVSGAAGGNIAGSVLKQVDLGLIGNSMVGILGGGVLMMIVGLIRQAMSKRTT